MHEPSSGMLLEFHCFILFTSSSQGLHNPEDNLNLGSGGNLKPHITSYYLESTH
jgi:hypothetical protein